jgi:hypothetical protein
MTMRSNIGIDSCQPVALTHLAWMASGTLPALQGLQMALPQAAPARGWTVPDAHLVQVRAAASPP